MAWTAKRGSLLHESSYSAFGTCTRFKLVFSLTETLSNVKSGSATHAKSITFKALKRQSPVFEHCSGVFLEIPVAATL